MSNFLQRLSRYRQTCGLSREEVGQKLGVTGKYVGMIERGEKVIDEESTISRLLKLLEAEAADPRTKEEPGIYKVAREVNLDPIPIRWVGILSWTHAGSAQSYEELPTHWQEQVPVTYQGKRVFALEIEGDSMEPRCFPGDIVIVTPDEDLRNGCLAVAKLTDDGIVLRRYMKLANGDVRLIPYNTLYPPVDYPSKSFHWIYPVHSTVRRELH